MKSLSFPLWKVKREIVRLLGHIMSGPSAAVQYYLGTPYYDYFLARQRKQWEGVIQIGERAAVYLIFPQNGILRTHVRALEYLVECGYAPIVVANGALSDLDLQRLMSLSARVIERANYGYDFGGYRDAILALASMTKSLRRLVLLNDSSWFPLPGSINWLAEAEALDVDFSAAAWSGAVARPAPWKFEEIEWTVDKTRRNFHYASFALGFSENILRDESFVRFWRGLRLAQKKNRTVRRGEIGLTSWVLCRGYSHGATTELYDFGARLSVMLETELFALLKNIVIFDDREMEAIRKKMIDEPKNDIDARRRIEKLIMTIVARRGASYALADYLVINERFPFLKKSPYAAGPYIPSNLTHLVRSLKGPIRDEILAEIF